VTDALGKIDKEATVATAKGKYTTKDGEYKTATTELNKITIKVKGSDVTLKTAYTAQTDEAPLAAKAKENYAVAQEIKKKTEAAQLKAKTAKETADKAFKDA